MGVPQCPGTMATPNQPPQQIGVLDNKLDSTKQPGMASEKVVSQADEAAHVKPPYSALPLGRRRLILAIVTVAGFLGPLAGNIYLPALPVFQTVFQTSATAINATVTSFMVVFAFAVRFGFFTAGKKHIEQ
jgi:hypothetical protein